MGRHDNLHEQYVAEIRTALDQLEPWWSRLLAERKAPPLSERWPFDQISHPRIVAIVRKYFIACQGLNIQIEEINSKLTELPTEAWGSDGEIYSQLEDYTMNPAVFIYEHFSRDEQDLSDIMQSFVFLPVGISDYIEKQQRSV